MIEVYKIEDFVLGQLFRPYESNFIDEEFRSIKYSDEKVFIERQLKKKPELIIMFLNDISETKKKVFDRLKRCGGVKWYHYLDVSNPVIRWVNEHLGEQEVE